MGFKPDAAPAEPDHGDVWRESDLKRAQGRVKRLQERIVQATEEGKWRKVKNLQRLLSRSWSARVCAVARVTTSRGSRTAGVDGELWTSDSRDAPSSAFQTHCWPGRGTQSRLIPMLEPYAVKVARTVLRRGAHREVGPLSAVP